MMQLLSNSVRWHGEADLTPQIRYLVPGLLPVRGVGLLLGESGIGKSFLGVHLATCLATGLPFLNWPVSERGGTLLVLGEGADTIPARLQASYENLPEHRKPKAAGLPICWAPAVSRELGRDLRLLWRQLKIRMEADHAVEPKLVIIDTLTTVMDLSDENNASEATRAMASLHELAREAEAFILAVVHPRKGATSDIRGSNAFRGSADLILRADSRRVSGQPWARAGRLSVMKCRFGEEGRTERFRLFRFPTSAGEPSCVIEADHSPPVPSGNPTSPVSDQPKSSVVLLECLARLQDIDCTTGPDGSAIAYDIARAEFYARWDADSHSATLGHDARRKAFARAVSALEARGALSQTVHGGKRQFVLRPPENASR